MVSDAQLLSHAIRHSLDRRRTAKRTYMVCGTCCMNYIFIRPKSNRICNICSNKLAMISTVDEFEVERIKSWAGKNIFEETRKESC